MSANLKRWCPLLGLAAILAQPVFAVVPVVKTVPWDPADSTLPHTTYPLSGGATEVTIRLVGTWQDPSNSGHTFQAVWDFGDGSPTVTVPNTLTPGSDPGRPFDASVAHQYPVGAPAGTAWTATLTVTDTTAGDIGTATVNVIQELDTLKSRTNVAIANGLWYMHSTFARALASGTPVGGWDSSLISGGFDNGIPSVGLDASNVLAFEVQGHRPNGPASDPYTEIAARGVQRLFQFMNSSPVAAKTYNFSGPPAACPGGLACTFTFDGNSNGHLIYANADGYNQPFYQGGMVIDALTAAGTPAATALLGNAGVVGQTFQNIVQDMIDGYNYCQSPFNPGGGWTYGCDNNSESHVDNSVSQWASIGEIAANRVMGIPIPSVVLNANSEWLFNGQATDAWPMPTAAGGSGVSNSNYYGAYTYAADWGRSTGQPCVAFENCWAWGPYADTPSGMVQLSMNGAGRTTNTLFGDGSTDPDQRFNYAETFERDNFCNPTSNGYTGSPRFGVYGMLSFSKSMRLHNPGGVLSPITFMRSLTPGVAALDWYNAIGPESGGGDQCDGFDETLVKRQGGGSGVAGNPDPSNTQGGYWSGRGFVNEHNVMETGWTIQILTGGVFVSCVNNLTGRGTAGGGRQPARIDLTWTDMTTPVDHYDMYVANGPSAPYSKIGSVPGTSSAFSDRSGLTNGNTFYFELHAVNSANVDICVSNADPVTVPAN